MNNQRRRQIDNVKSKLETINEPINMSLVEICKSEIESILSDEEFAFDCMPENLQDSMRGCDSQDAQESMQNAIDSLEEDKITIENIEDAIDSLNNIM